MTRRVATVFTHDLEPVQRGKEVGLIPLGLRERGWEVELHAPAGSADGWAYPVHIAPLPVLSSAEYWEERAIDAALVYSFFRHERLMATMRSTGARVVVKGDTDGLLSARLWPRETFAIALHHAAPPHVRAAQVAHWLARLGPLHRRDARAVVGTVRAADALAVESGPAAARIAAILRGEAAGDLTSRLHVIPSPVAPVFAAGDAGGPRERIVVAAGRWDDGQKNAPLLVRGLTSFLADHPDWHAVVVGGGATRRLAPLVHRFAAGRVETIERLAQDDLATLLRRSRIVTSSSRYESFSLAVHEGLASGCSLATTPLAPFEHAVAQGPFGTLASGHAPPALAEALAREAAAWEAGERDPVAGAAFWRARLSIDAVAARFEELLA